ncbi:MAG: pyridoxal phosphate-dependent aminotransferase, partial [Gammaproteobacteria bacterium]
MDVRPSQRAASVKTSPTLAVAAEAAALARAGREILNLAAGQPDFDTPAHVKDAAIAALDAEFTKYTEVDGTPELKAAILRKFARDNGLNFRPEHLLVSCGGKHSLYNLMQALLNEDDEVLIPAPYWVSYPDMARLAGADPVIIRTKFKQHFKITPEQLRGALGPRSRLLILNSPANPSGAVYSHRELEALGAVLLEFPEVIVVSDDIFEHVRWNGDAFVNILNAVPRLHERAVIVNGVSKAYGMAGWRIGYAAGPAPLIAAMKKIQSQSTSNPTSIAQAAACAALDGDQAFLAERNAEYRRRHDFVLRELALIRGVDVHPAEGSFFVFPDMRGVIDRRGDIDDDVALAELLLEQAGIAVVP